MAKRIIDYQKFLRTLNRDIARDAEAHVRPRIRDISRTLAHFLKAELVAEQPGIVLSALTVPHYWAHIVHRGRGPSRPSAASVLVWFRNPADDPRYPGGRYPQRLSEVRRLTKDEWDYWREQNRIAQEAGRPEPMIVARYSKGVEAKPFFSNKPPNGGMVGFPDRAIGLANQASRDFIHKAIGKRMNWEVKTDFKIS